jgi:hypothetical protein
MPRLKVFCATSGFHDSIVAVPSRPAALKAWGARTDLFSMGVAKQVTDPKVIKKALARPGEVIRLNRSGNKKTPAPRKNARPTTKPPSRAKLTAAEKKLAEIEKKQAKERETVDRELAELKRRSDEIDKRHAKARSLAEAKLEEAREDYRSQLDRWPGKIDE